MGASEAQSGGAAPRVINPLWIISLFLGLSETMTGIVAIQATGWIQGLFALFAVVFPLLAAGTFFAILWKRPEVLYAPGDFPEHVPVPDFVESMHRGMAGNISTIGLVVRDTLEVVLPQVLDGRVTAVTAEAVVAEAVETAQASLESSILTIDFSLISAEFGPYDWVVSNSTPVSDLLDELWLTVVRDHVPAFTYGGLWVLVETSTSKVFDQMGSLWAVERSLERDERPLGEVGVEPGMELAAVRAVDLRDFLRSRTERAYVLPTLRRLRYLPDAREEEWSISSKPF